MHKKRVATQDYTVQGVFRCYMDPSQPYLSLPKATCCYGPLLCRTRVLKCVYHVHFIV